MSRLSEKHRKIISISVVLITLIVMAGSFIYIAFKDPSVTQVVGKESSEARYVLVNEDDGWEFENKNYQLGRDLSLLFLRMNRISGRHQIVVKPKQALRVENTMQ